MAADPGGQGGHRGVIQVERAAVGGVGVQRAERGLPHLGRKGAFEDKELCQTPLPLSSPLLRHPSVTGFEVLHTKKLRTHFEMQ